ncbi:MAG: cytochrome c oxidase assembly protein [Candidatus Zixiibacteriota bacterium]|jgi:cytochrome c oxidase assembly factor CtaG
MSTWDLFAQAWEWHISIIVGCIALLVGYLYFAGFRLDRRTFYFILGDVILLFTLVGPLDVLGDDYLFSAHMLEHLVLELVVPPLLLFGLSPRLARKMLSWRPAAAVERVLGTPLLAWFLGIGTLWLWHFPALYNLALAHENIHIIQHLSFLVTATVFWWPILAPEGYRRLTGMRGVFYLYFAALANGTLGALLTFAPVGFYPHYLHPADELGALSLIRNGWGFSPSMDQQLGGLFMWVMGGTIFLWAVLLTFSRWFLKREGSRPSVHASETAGSKL